MVVLRLYLSISLKTTLFHFLPDGLTDAADWKYQLWELHPLSIELRTDKVYKQKLDYIHRNTVRRRTCKLPKENARMFHFLKQLLIVGMLSHYRN